MLGIGVKIAWMEDRPVVGSHNFSYLAIATGFCILQVNVSWKINDFLFTAAL